MVAQVSEENSAMSYDGGGIYIQYNSDVSFSGSTSFKRELS